MLNLRKFQRDSINISKVINFIRTRENPDNFVVLYITLFLLFYVLENSLSCRSIRFIWVRCSALVSLHRQRIQQLIRFLDRIRSDVDRTSCCPLSDGRAHLQWIHVVLGSSDYCHDVMWTCNV